MESFMNKKQEGVPQEEGMFIGRTASVKAVVDMKNTAKAVGSGDLPVFATPMMVALMERAACACLADVLATGQSSVGTSLSIEHTAASAIGAEVTATATIIAVDRRKIEFEVSTKDGKGEIGHGRHERFIVDTEKFMAKAEGKKRFQTF